MIMKTSLLAAATALTMSLTGAASAATFDIVDNPGGQTLADEMNIPNYGVFGQTLIAGDSVSITFDGANALTSVGVGFNTNPSNVAQFFELVFTSTDFNDFGTTDVFLSTSTSTSDAFDSATIDQPFGFVQLSGVANTSPFYVLYEFSNASFGSFTGDLTISEVAPIPVPAAGLLMFGALGGLAGLRRRKNKKAAA